jgi:type II secretory pathway component PulC
MYFKGFVPVISFLTKVVMKRKITLIFALGLLIPYLVKADDAKIPEKNIKAQEPKNIKAEPVAKSRFFFGYLNLAGTVLVSGKDRKQNKAIFQDVFTRKKVTFHEGSLLPYGIKLKRIEKSGVVLEKKGEELTLTLGDKNNYFREIKSLKRNGYKQIAQNEWVVNSHYLFKSTQDMIKSAVESGLTLKKSGKKPGIEIAKDADKKIAGLGFEKGDKVININGTALDGLKGLASAYQKMKQSDNVTIKVLRDGKPVELKYWMAKRGSPRYNMRQVLSSDKIKKLLSM